MSFDLVHIWETMPLISKIVAGWLMIYFVLVVAVAVERLIAFQASASESRLFARSVAKALESWNLDEVLKVAKKHDKSALAKLFAAIVQRFQRGLESEDDGLSPVDMARHEFSRRSEQIGADLRRGFPILASIGSTAPFVGLLGTVLGIIGAFQGIAASGGGGLGAVSAGIAEALIETAFGLLVAIPAVLIYNYYSGRANDVEAALARSAGELLDEMENRYGGAE